MQHIPHAQGQHGRRVGRDVEHIFHHQIAAPRAVDHTAGEESTQEEEAVDELCAGAGETDFVAEPVDVEEWAGKLEEDEDRGVEVDEWALEVGVSFWFTEGATFGGGRFFFFCSVTMS